MAKREQARPWGFVGLLFKARVQKYRAASLNAELSVKLPAENQSFMRFLLSKMGFYMRLSGGGVGV